MGGRNVNSSPRNVRVLKVEQIEQLLWSLQRENFTIIDDNRKLKEQLEFFEKLSRSRGFRFLERLEHAVRRHDPFKWIPLPERTKPAVRAAFRRLVTRFEPAPNEWQRFLRSLAECRENIKIVHTVFGGVGDAVWSTAVIEAIKHKYLQSDVYVFIDRAWASDVFCHNPYITDVFVVEPSGYQVWREGMREVLDHGLLDAWYENKYQTKVHYGKRSRIPEWERSETEAAFEENQVNFDEFPMGNNLISAVAQRRGMNLLQTVAKSAVLDLSDPQLRLFPTVEDLAILPAVEALGDYVTVHQGSDAMRASKEFKITEQTKNWRSDRWEAVIAHIKSTTSLQVVQLGMKDEPRLRGAIHDFMGRTNTREAALILQRARFHLDTEGGVAHIARAAHTPALVLFGPTPVEFFGYPQNANLKAGDCHSCWWSTLDWWKECPRGLEVPECMDEIKPAAVTREVDALVKRTAGRGRSYRLEEMTFIDENFGKGRDSIVRAIYQVANIDFQMARGRTINPVTGAYADTAQHWQYIFAVDRLESYGGSRNRLKVLNVEGGRGALSLYWAELGHEIHICSTTYSEESPDGRDHSVSFLESLRDKVYFRLGTPLNLPYETSSFDAVVGLSVMGRFPRRGAAIDEMLRVLKPGGILIASVDMTPGAPGYSLTPELLSEELARLGVAYAPDPRELRKIGALVLRKESTDDLAQRGDFVKAMQ